MLGLPGGVAKAIPEDKRAQIKALGEDLVEFAGFSLELFHELVLANADFRALVTGDVYYGETNYMGLVDESNRVALYDGDVRVVGPAGDEVVRFGPERYADHIAEHVEDWTYIKFPYLKKLGWKGFTDGPDSGVYRVAPLARLNTAEGMATPLAQAEYELMFETLGGRPAGFTLANHWARLIEVLYVAERIRELAELPELTSPKVRNMDLKTPRAGVGAVEAPRGTLFHHYETDERGLVTGCNLVVATVGNSTAICMSVERAAKRLIRGGEVNDALLDMVEMAFRAYDPCLSCATHALPGRMPLVAEIRGPGGELVRTLTRGR